MKKEKEADINAMISDEMKRLKSDVVTDKPKEINPEDYWGSNRSGMIII